MRTVMIVAGESSGELYGSLLARALKERWPDMRLLGIGGERMQREGVELLSGLSHSFGLIGFSSIVDLWNTYNKARKAIDDFRPSVCVLIDYPDFNFRLGRYARRQGIKVLYYVGPQVWAWRRGRVKRMKEVAERLALILPFEVDFYKKEGIMAEFVGHPIMEEIDERGILGTRKDPSEPVIALLPGSRPNELKRHLPVFVSLVGLLKSEVRKASFILPFAPNIDPFYFEKELRDLQGKEVEITEGNAIGALSKADAAVVASGTATLQAAFMGVPMVVIYKMSYLTYLLGRLILDVEHISLVNILAGKGIVPELIQERASPEGIIEELKRLIFDQDYRDEMVFNLNRLRAPFSNKNPSKRVSEMIAEMAGWA